MNAASKLATTAHVPTTHARVVPSFDALNSRSPCTNSTQTVPLWSVTVASSTPVASSDTRMLLSA